MFDGNASWWFDEKNRMKYILFAFLLVLLMSACSPEETSKSSTKNIAISNKSRLSSLLTKADNELYYQFKRYAEENPSFSKHSFIETESMGGMTIIDWLSERNLSLGLDTTGALLVINSGNHNENLLPSILDCLQKMNEYVDSFLNTSSTLKEYSSTLSSSSFHKLFGLTLESNRTSSIDAKETLTTNLMVGVGENSLIYSRTVDDANITTDIKEMGLSRMDLLKFIYYNEGLTIVTFKINNSEQNTSYYDNILIARISGKVEHCYENSNIKQLELNYEGGMLEKALVWKPNGEKCLLSGVENGNGFLIKYNDAGRESYRSRYKNGERIFDY